MRFPGSLVALVACHGVAAAPAVPPVELDVDGARIEVDFPSADLPREAIVEWIRASAHAVGSWYHGFPVHDLRIEVRAVPGGGIGFASAWPGAPPHIDLPVGRRANAAVFAVDWELVHEMTHLAFPSVADEHHWIEEGLATYLEPWERVAVGTLTPEAAWHDFARDLHQGLPGPGDEGLDRTHTWGRTYWGGALYCFTVDLEIRRQTGNQLGLREAVAAISQLGGMAGEERDLADVLAIGDQAVGRTVMTDTWRQMAEAPVSPDLDAMFRGLGVEMAGATVIFHDDAPEAAIRRAIAPVPDPGQR